MFDLWKPVLGKQLFHEPRLSRDNTGSCASDHKLDYGGRTARPLSTAAVGQAE